MLEFIYKLLGLTKWHFDASDPPMMRRRVNGKWEYRPATPDEIETAEEMRAW